MTDEREHVFCRMAQRRCDMAKPNWKKIKQEYITSEIGMRPLAEKHGVSFNTLKKHAIPEQWALAREQYQLIKIFQNLENL